MPSHRRYRCAGFIGGIIHRTLGAVNAVQSILLHKLGLPLCLLGRAQLAIHGLAPLGGGRAPAAQQVCVNVVHFLTVAHLKEFAELCYPFLRCFVIGDSLNLRTRATSDEGKQKSLVSCAPGETNNVQSLKWYTSKKTAGSCACCTTSLLNYTNSRSVSPSRPPKELCSEGKPWEFRSPKLSG